MAVFQISRIQIRRGQKNTGPGLPQLASGEMAWAIDTQELYIGNGAVAEGAPAIGNTKILTQNDNILDLAEQYSYKRHDGTIQTGLTSTTPVMRTLQEKLDDFVTGFDYGIVSDNTDMSEKLQNAIDDLFLDTISTGPASRVSFYIPPGEYTLSETIYLPSYVSIIGAGVQKTVFNFTGTGCVFEFVNDTSTRNVRSTLNTTTYNNQPKFCTLKGFTVKTNADDVEGIKLNAVRNSEFSDLEFIGTYDSVAAPATSIGIGFYAVSAAVTCQKNYFDRVTANGFTYDVYAKQDIIHNRFENCEFTNARWGVNFGTGANLFSTGEQYGPRKNSFENCMFSYIDREGIYVENGYGNRSHSNTFIDVGNDGGGNNTNLYSQIRFVSSGNSSAQDTFDRERDLAGVNNVDYIAEVGGKNHFEQHETFEVNLLSAPSTPLFGFRVPFTGTSKIRVDYVLNTSLTQIRTGTMTLSIDATGNTVRFVDEYEYNGTSGMDDNIEFTASLGSGDWVEIFYLNTNVIGTTSLTYSYTVLS